MRGLASARGGICIRPEFGPRGSQEARAGGLQSRPGKGLRLPTGRRGLEIGPWVPRSVGETLGETLPTLLSAGERPPGRLPQLRAATRAVGRESVPDALEPARRPQEGREAGRLPLAPRCAPRASPVRLARAPEAPRGPRLAAPRMAGIENLALSASDLIFLYLSTIILFPPDLSSFTASFSFVFHSPSVCLSHFLGIRFLSHSFSFSFLRSPRSFY